MFYKSERSTFKYWFAHWCAFQMTALNMRVWKPKYLLHDAEKPWLRLILPYKKVQKFHRNHAKHHLEYFRKNPKKIDWLAMVIDWECSHFTKAEATKTAREEYYEIMSQIEDKELLKALVENFYPILEKYNLK